MNPTSAARSTGYVLVWADFEHSLIHFNSILVFILYGEKHGISEYGLKKKGKTF